MIRRLGLLAIAAITLTACAQKTTPYELCEQTVRDYALLRDDPAKAEPYAELFTETGSFELGGNIVKGREALTQRHIASHQNAAWRHNMTDISIKGIQLKDKGGKMIGQSRFIVQTGAKSEKPVPMSREIIGTYHDQFKIVDGSCKFQSRKVDVLFDSAAKD